MLFHDGRVNLLSGDCLDVMAGLEPDSFDACVTDPPYHFASIVKRFQKTGGGYQMVTEPGPYLRHARGFMGQKWDGGQIAHDPATWAAVLRVLKPGAHLVAFHAPKNWHRLACAIEDAGFEIRDTLLWLFGSGFPKSHNVGKAIDKELGAERTERTGTKSGHESFVGRADHPLNGGWDRPWASNPEAVDRYHSTFAPASDLAKQFDGFGTALKPAYEPIILARKPLAGTVAANVMQHGTGALNIDACRVEFAGDGDGRASKDKNRHGDFESEPRRNNVYGKDQRAQVNYDATGRWPANVCHDGSDEVVEVFPEQRSSGDYPSDNIGTGNGVTYMPIKQQGRLYSDQGSAARFFYTAKADADDRLGSKHPTVKPLDLMQWLVRLVTPPKGMILDPFAGTGTTAEAALREGFRCTLIEREADYVADIERRMKHVFDGDVGRSVAMARLKKEQGEVPLFDFQEAAE